MITVPVHPSALQPQETCFIPSSRVAEQIDMFITMLTIYGFSTDRISVELEYEKGDISDLHRHKDLSRNGSILPFYSREITSPKINLSRYQFIMPQNTYCSQNCILTVLLSTDITKTVKTVSLRSPGQTSFSMDSTCTQSTLS